jgi:putative transposase
MGARVRLPRRKSLFATPLSRSHKSFQRLAPGTAVALLFAVARIPRRYLVDLGSTNHCTWRSHNFSFVLQSDVAKLFFLALIAKYAPRHGILVRSYCLMGTHPHVVVEATNGQLEFSRFWQVVNQLFARWYNRQHKSRRGQVVTQRMKSPRIQPDASGRHVLTVMRYGDLNPVRAGMVRSPKDYAWSSYRHYAFGEPNPLITDEPAYLGLGRTATERMQSYRQLFSQPLSKGLHRTRPDIVEAPFFGDPRWVTQRLARITDPPRPG